MTIPEPILPPPREDPAVLARLDSVDRGGLETLIALWQGHLEAEWAGSAEVYRRLASRLVELGSHLQAVEVAVEGLRRFAGDPRLRQVLGLALARSGALHRARATLIALRQEGHEDEETLGVLARTHKDLATLAGDPAERARQFGLAHDLYLESFRRSGGGYSGVNAATTALLAGRVELVSELARDAGVAARAELEAATKRGKGEFFPLATLGEVALLLGDEHGAARWYGNAVAAGPTRFGNLASARRQARLIAGATGRLADLVESMLPVPRVAVCTGHMIDSPTRPAPRFPPEAEAEVAAALQGRLRAHRVGFGYASAASGADLLFLEAIAALKGTTTIVLACGIDEFLADSVAPASGADWTGRFREAVARAGPNLRIATEQRFGRGGALHEYAAGLLLGLATLKSRELDTELIPIAIWDGRPGDGPGGTAAHVARWRELGYPVEVISLATPTPSPVSVVGPAPRTAASAPPAAPGTEPPIRLAAVLFADVVHFSSLTDAAMPRFVEHFLGEVGRLVHTSPYAPLVRNTWGDGLYFVFSGVRDAGRFALALASMVARTDWAARGLPRELGIRIALHAGPLFECVDPVTDQLNYTGKHTVRAARIEPVTPPGLVYATEEFAAIAATLPDPGFRCQPVGRLGLAKAAGTFPIFVVTDGVEGMETLPGGE